MRLLLPIGVASSWVLRCVAASIVDSSHGIPDLPLLFSMSIGLTAGPWVGAATGFASGMLQDLAIGRYLGLNALGTGVAGYLAGIAGARLFREGAVVPAAVGFGGSLAADATRLLILWCAGSRISMVGRLPMLLKAALLNCLLMPVVYSLTMRAVTAVRHSREREVA